MNSVKTGWWQPRRSVAWIRLPAMVISVACAGDGTGLDQDGNPIIAGGSIELSSDDVALPVAGTLQMVATVRDGDGIELVGRQVQWSSNDPDVADVSPTGLVTARAVGKAVITAVDGAITAQADVTVVLSALFGADVQPIFSGSCALSNCHAAPNPQRGMNLSVGNAYANIVNVPAVELPSMFRITPGEPARSYLVHKIRGTQLGVGGEGSQMPQGRGPLPDAEIDIIRAWVQVGAANN